MFILVNFKTYPCDPVAVAEAAAAVGATTDARLAVAPQPTDLADVAETGIETWAQHVDPIAPGSNTGSILAESVARSGATGTLLNHSERRVRLDQLEESLAASERADLETIVCANTPDQAAAATALGPDAVAIEPPELIGTGTPVSQADPDIVEDAVEAVEAVDESVPVLCGAGISTGADVVAARDLGAEGVLLASGVAKADDPAGSLDSLVDPL